MTDLIRNTKMRYDLVMFDSPPILGVSDGAVLASEVDLSIMVIEHRRFPRSMLQRVKQAVFNVGGNLMGVVLNKVDAKHDSGYGYYGELLRLLLDPEWRGKARSGCRQGEWPQGTSRGRARNPRRAILIAGASSNLFFHAEAFFRRFSPVPRPRHSAGACAIPVSANDRFFINRTRRRPRLPAPSAAPAQGCRCRACGMATRWKSGSPMFRRRMSDRSTGPTRWMNRGC